MPSAQYREISRFGYPLTDGNDWRMPELGELLAGNKVYVRAPDDITISKHIGLGVEDVAVAGECYKRLFVAG